MFSKGCRIDYIKGKHGIQNMAQVLLTLSESLTDRNKRNVDDMGLVVGCVLITLYVLWTFS